MKLLIHLVSGQNVPNYIASKIINPDINIFLFSPDSKIQMNYLKKILCVNNNCNTYEIDAWNFNANYSLAKQIISQNLSNEIILNFTGGTKITSFAFFSAFKDMKKKAVYINTEKDILTEFNFDGISITEENIPINIKGNLNDYFGLTGQILKSETNSDMGKYIPFRNFIVDNFNSCFPLTSKIAQLSSKLNQFNEVFKVGKFEGSAISFINNTSNVSIVYKQNMVFEMTENGDGLIKYISGGWFEHLCFEKISAQNIFDDLKMNAKIDFLHKSPHDRFQDKNEIDILAIKGVYPVIFECKSGGFKSENIDKLISIKDYVGRYTDTYFLTFMPLDNYNSAHKMLTEKMIEKKIKHITYRDLNSLTLKKKSNIK